MFTGGMFFKIIYLLIYLFLSRDMSRQFAKESVRPRGLSFVGRLVVIPCTVDADNGVGF